MSRRALSERCRNCGGNRWREIVRLSPKGKQWTGRKCLTCRQWTGARLNANRARTHEQQPAFRIDRREFAAWAEQTPAVCYSCGVPEHLLEGLGIRTQMNLPLRWLGLDRLDGGDYTLDNVAWCCYPCNSTKSNRFTAEEMKTRIGPSLAAVWRDRLRAAGISDPWIEEDDHV